MLASQAPHALAFTTQHYRNRPLQITVVKHRIRRIAGAINPDPGITQLPQGTRKIGDCKNRHGLHGTAGNLVHHRCYPHGPVLRHDHRMHTGRIGRAQTGTQVVWILDAVEHQQKGRLG